MASTGDKITDVRNAARPVTTTVYSGRSGGGTSLVCVSLTGWPTASKVHFVTYQIDSNSNPVAGTQLDCQGIVSGNTVNSFSVIDGNDTGNVIGDVVEMLPTAAWGQDLADALTHQHSRIGAHVGVSNTGGMTTDTLTVSGASVLTGGTALPAGDIGTADIAEAAVTDDKLVYGKVRQRQGGTTGDASWQTGGTSNTDTSAKGTFMQVGSTGVVNSTLAITFPIAFTQAPIVIVVANSATSTNAFAEARSVTSTGFTVGMANAGGTPTTTESCNWVAIGQ